jgi:hypothetical protein
MTDEQRRAELSDSLTDYSFTSEEMNKHKAHLLRQAFRGLLDNDVIVRTVFNSYMNGSYPSFELALIDMIVMLAENNKQQNERVIKLLTERPLSPIVVPLGKSC